MTLTIGSAFKINTGIFIYSDNLHLRPRGNFPEDEKARIILIRAFSESRVVRTEPHWCCVLRIYDRRRMANRNIVERVTATA